MQLTCEVVAYNSDSYRQMVALRNAVLRIPLGKTLTAEEIERDAQLVHLAAFDNAKQVVATALLQNVADSQEAIQVRQVAVAPSLQKTGVGAALMAFAEAEARKQSYHTMILHARDVAVPFYMRIGYHTVGDYFEETGIPHIHMEKSLTPQV
ncbi:MAG: GNAT family N-acetyltransferase [Alphaproteobacteria bacterium]|nr:GNAT family N-acetyltransferase [Alphaproteobacteria bacterium]